MSRTVNELEQELETTTDTLQRIDLLNEISSLTFVYDPSGALQKAETARVHAEKHAKKRGEKTPLGISLRMIGICKVVLANYDDALQDYDEALSIFREIGDQKMIAATLHSIGFAYIRMGQYVKALEYLEKCLKIRHKLDDRRDVAQTLSIVGLCYKGLADYARALDYHMQCLDIHQELGYGTGIAWDHDNIGDVFIELGDLDRALEDFHKSLDLAHELNDKRIERSALNHLGKIHSLRSQYKEALDCYTPALLLSREMGDRADEVLTLTRMGHLHAQRNEHQSAFEHLFQALKISEHIGTRHQQCDLLKSIGEVHLDMGEAEALDYLERALEGARQLGDRGLEGEIHKGLSRYFEQQGDALKALDHFKIHAQIKEEVLGGEKQRAIAQMQMRSEIEKAEKEREIVQLKNQQLVNEMDHKTKELTTTALHLVEKNRFLDSVKKEIAETAVEFDGKPKIAMRSLMRKIDGNISTEEDWKVFENQFEQVHHGFLDALSRRHPDLTRQQLKVCALLKLNRANKEIADILSMEVRNVESHRHRIRKRLNLPGSTSFAAYFAMINE